MIRNEKLAACEMLFQRCSDHDELRIAIQQRQKRRCLRTDELVNSCTLVCTAAQFIGIRIDCNNILYE